MTFVQSVSMGSVQRYENNEITKILERYASRVICFGVKLGLVMESACIDLP